MTADMWSYASRREVSASFSIIIKNLSVASRHDKHTKYRQVRMRGDADTLWLIQKIPSGDALGASDSCMLHTLTVHTSHNEEKTNILTKFQLAQIKFTDTLRFTSSYCYH